MGANGRVMHRTAGWSMLSTGLSADLTAVWPVSATEVWVVGKQGTPARLTKASAGAWSATMATSPPNDLRGLWAAHPAAVWAVGANGWVMRYDGAAWSSQSVGLDPLNAIFGTSVTNIWIEGDNGTVIHGH